MRTASPFLDIARPLAVQAAHRIRELSRLPLTQTRKADHSIVTNADHAADEILRQGLRRAFPDHAILTEESGLDGAPDAEYVWLVDPLDGTNAFARGSPGYSVMVGLLKNLKPVAGVVVDPVEGHIFEAEHGKGAFHILNDVRTRLHVSSRNKLEEMPVITSTEFPDSKEVALRRLIPGPWIRALNSVGIKVGVIIRQLADIYINHHKIHFWDTCAPLAILEEAGGTMTYWDGSPIAYPMSKGQYRHPLPTLATNGPRHAAILDILRPLLE